MIAGVSVGGLVLVTSLGVMLTVVRRCRRLKHDGNRSAASTELDDFVKLLCYTSRRRRRRSTAGQGIKPPSPSHTGTDHHHQQQPVVLPDQNELVPIALRSLSVGEGLLQENERYSSAADINARGALISLFRMAQSLVQWATYHNNNFSEFSLNRPSLFVLAI